MKEGRYLGVFRVYTQAPVPPIAVCPIIEKGFISWYDTMRIRIFRIEKDLGEWRFRSDFDYVLEPLTLRGYREISDQLVNPPTFVSAKDLWIFYFRMYFGENWREEIRREEWKVIPYPNA